MLRWIITAREDGGRSLHSEELGEASLHFILDVVKCKLRSIEMIGDRIKLARRKAGLSLRGLSTARRGKVTWSHNQVMDSGATT